MSNKDFLIYLKDFLKKKDREELKKKLKENYYDRRLNNEHSKYNGR